MAELHRPSTNGGGGQALYLLFAGRHADPAPGVGSLVATFASPEEARAAFRQARLNLSDREGWAELTLVVPGSRAKPLSWFGAERRGAGQPLSGLLTPAERPAAPAGAVRGRRRLALRRRAGLGA